MTDRDILINKAMELHLEIQGLYKLVEDKRVEHDKIVSSFTPHERSEYFRSI